MTFEFLLPEQIKPKGWLLRQLQTQGEGLGGNLDKIWPDIRDSKWLGGAHEGWERLPYFLDGFIPLAYLTGDADKQARAKRYVYGLLSCQREDGGFYPVGETEAGDIWSIFLILKVLTLYADCAKDDKIETAVERGLRFLDCYLNGHTPYNWAASRWFECLIPILWLYRRRKEGWLLRLAVRLKALGVDYATAVSLWDEVKNQWSYETHAVNIAMALKSEALYCELMGTARSGLAEKMINTLFTYHSTAYGHFTGDECLSGDSPSQGSELCGIVEAMYSYEWLTALTGEAKWGDLLEDLTFNALPATFTTDMWAHQYDQQVNQIACKEFPKSVFRTNGPQSNMFGLEPNYGCCTANFGQGWCKFALSAYMRQGEKLIVLSPMPAELDFGGKIVCESEYPFRPRFRMTAERPTKAAIRIPARVKASCSAPHEVKDGWLLVTIDGTVEVEFSATPQLEDRPQGRKCLRYGALLFALPVAYEKKTFEYVRDDVERKFPYCDYEFSPVGEWRYAFASKKFTVEEPPYDLPFDREHPPLKIKTQLAPVEWEREEGYGEVASPVAGTCRRGRNETLCLQPYGATYLRVTEMALVK